MQKITVLRVFSVISIPLQFLWLSPTFTLSAKGPEPNSNKQLIWYNNVWILSWPVVYPALSVPEGKLDFWCYKWNKVPAFRGFLFNLNPLQFFATSSPVHPVFSASAHHKQMIWYINVRISSWSVVYPALSVPEGKLDFVAGSKCLTLQDLSLCYAPDVGFLFG